MKLETCMDQIETFPIVLCFESTHCLCNLDVHPNPSLSSNDNTIVGGGELATFLRDMRPPMPNGVVVANICYVVGGWFM
jgi:hypothetical protein